MSKCIGNCALCELDVDKTACCAVQTLKNSIQSKAMLTEAKALLSEVRELLTAKKVDVFASIPDIDSEPTALGAEIQQL